MVSGCIEGDRFFKKNFQRANTDRTAMAATAVAVKSSVANIGPKSVVIKG